jgi:sulfur carrier protein
MVRLFSVEDMGKICFLSQDEIDCIFPVFFRILDTFRDRFCVERNICKYKQENIMIKVNDTSLDWRKGLTVEKLLRENNFIVHLSVVRINGLNLNKKSYHYHIINDGDDIKIMHLVAGG